MTSTQTLLPVCLTELPRQLDVVLSRQLVIELFNHRHLEIQVQMNEIKLRRYIYARMLQTLLMIIYIMYIYYSECYKNSTHKATCLTIL